MLCDFWGFTRARIAVARPDSHNLEARVGRRLGWTVASGVLLFAAVLVVFLMPWGPRMIDLEVYRAGARAVLAGTDPYAVTGPDGLPFTYPVFAALIFVP